MPRFSVVIPTYNRRTFVVKAIDSVLNQTCTDYELIVVDDGSTDGTKQALERYGEKICFLRQDNAGVSAARNAGIRQARGEWIAFLDSDDEWAPDYLATQMRHIWRYPQAVAHVVNADNLFPDGKVNNHFAGMGLLEEFRDTSCILLEKPFRCIVSHTHWFLQAVVVRRDVLLQVGLLDQELSIAEDMDLVGRLALRGPFTLCSETLVHIYRRQEELENLAAQFTKKGVASRRAFGKVFSGFLEQPGLSLQERLATAKVLCANWRALGNILLLAGRIAEARDMYLQSFRVFPAGRSLLKYMATFLPRRLSALSVRRGRDIEPGEDADSVRF